MWIRRIRLLIPFLIRIRILKKGCLHGMWRCGMRRRVCLVWMVRWRLMLLLVGRMLGRIRLLRFKVSRCLCLRRGWMVLVWSLLGWQRMSLVNGWITRISLLLDRGMEPLFIVVILGRRNEGFCIIIRFIKLRVVILLSGIGIVWVFLIRIVLAGIRIRRHVLMMNVRRLSMCLVVQMAGWLRIIRLQSLRCGNKRLRFRSQIRSGILKHGVYMWMRGICFYCWRISRCLNLIRLMGIRWLRFSLIMVMLVRRGRGCIGWILRRIGCMVWGMQSCIVLILRRWRRFGMCRFLMVLVRRGIPYRWLWRMMGCILSILGRCLRNGKVLITLGLCIVLIMMGMRYGIGLLMVVWIGLWRIIRWRSMCTPMIFMIIMGASRIIFMRWIGRLVRRFGMCLRLVVIILSVGLSLQGDMVCSIPIIIGVMVVVNICMFLMHITAVLLEKCLILVMHCVISLCLRVRLLSVVLIFYWSLILVWVSMLIISICMGMIVWGIRMPRR